MVKACNCGDMYFVREIRRPTYDKGVKVSLKISTQRDFDRLVFTSHFTSIRIAELDFEKPVMSMQEGAVTTVGGLIDQCIRDLQHNHSEHKSEDPDAGIQTDLMISKLRALKLLKNPFTLILQDNAGTCHVLNPSPGLKDFACEVTHFKRNDDLNRSVGLYPGFDEAKLRPIPEGEFTLEHLAKEVVKFTVDCEKCKKHLIAIMKTTDFKDVVILAATCKSCGHETNEVRSGSGVEAQGIRIEIVIKEKEDFGRNVLTSKTCDMEIPELEMNLSGAAFGGRFATIKRIIEATKDQLSSSPNVSQLVDVLDGKKQVTIVLNDPAGKSYIQSLADNGPDERLKIMRYNRTEEQNEQLGLNDMDV